MEDDIKQSYSKHALAPTDPLQVETDSEDQSANLKRIVCVVGEFFFGSFWCIHQDREQRKKRP